MYTLVILCSIIGTTITAKLPTYIKGCSISNPNVKQCMINSAQNAIDTIRQGDKAYKVPSYHPTFTVPLVDISMGDDLRIIFEDVIVYSFRDIKIKDVDWDPKEEIFTVKFHNPYLTADVKYSINMKLMGLPITGKGNGNLTLTGWDIVYSPKLTTVKENGVDYLTIKSTMLDFEIKDLKLYFANLFNGDPRLGEATNNLLNDNWREMYDVLKPTMVAILTGLFDNTLKGYLSTVPKDEIFLP